MLTQELKLLLSQLVLAKKNLPFGCSFSSEATRAHTIDIFTQGKRSRTRFCLLFLCFVYIIHAMELKKRGSADSENMQIRDSSKA
jgi:hypothetical protein